MKSKVDANVKDRRRFAQEETSTALEKPPGMSLAGQAALAQARPSAEFAVAPIVSAEAIAEIKKVVEQYKIRPPRGWILIKELPPAERIGHILVPEVCQEPPKFGIVIAVGAGEWQMGHEIPPEVKAGDHVTFASFAGEQREILGQKLIQMRTDEIMLIAG